MGGTQTITLSHVEMSVAYQAILRTLSAMMTNENKNDRRVAELTVVVESIQQQMEANWAEHEAAATLEKTTKGLRFISSIPALGEHTGDFA